MRNDSTSCLHGGNDYFHYVSAQCSLGFVLTAVSPDRICAILFGDTSDELDRAIRSEFPDRDPTYGGYGLEGIGAQTVNAVETRRDIGGYRWGVERKRALLDRELRRPVEL